jgi:hypothetical protein
MDIDPWNPAAAPPVGVILHGLFQVLPNFLTGSDTDYVAMAGKLGISVDCSH